MFVCLSPPALVFVVISINTATDTAISLYQAASSELAGVNHGQAVVAASENDERMTELSRRLEESQAEVSVRTSLWRV